MELVEGKSPSMNIAMRASWERPLAWIFSIHRRRGSMKLYRLDTDRVLLLDTNLLTSVFSVVLADALDRALTSKRGLVPAVTASAEFG
jgi:hypothetical protein